MVVALVASQNSWPGKRYQEESDDGEITAQGDDRSDSRLMMKETNQIS